MAEDFLTKTRELAAADTQYAQEAFVFVMESLHSYSKQHGVKPGEHITAKQLLEGLRDYALANFGPMALFTLDSWGIRTTYDVGILVYRMIEAGLMGKQDSDSLEDFRNVFDLKAALPEDYSPPEEDKEK